MFLWNDGNPSARPTVQLREAKPTGALNGTIKSGTPVWSSSNKRKTFKLSLNVPKKRSNVRCGTEKTPDALQDWDEPFGAVEGDWTGGVCRNTVDNEDTSNKNNPVQAYNRKSNVAVGFHGKTYVSEK